MPQSASGLPLFAWLIPKLLNEVKDCEFHDIEQYVLEIVKRSVRCKGRTAKSLGGSDQLPKYVRACIAGTRQTT